MFRDFYNIRIYHNERDLEVDALTVEFNVVDSIHSFYSKGTLIFSDPVGIIKESLSANEGNKYRIKFGNTLHKGLVDSPFIVESSELLDLEKQGSLNGKVQLNLVHEFFSSQECLSDVYQESISSIVDKNTQYNFKKKNIENVSSSDIWYKMGETQKDFICNTLLNNTPSSSPIFAFITSHGEFNYSSYDTLLKDYNLKLYYGPQIADDTTSETIINLTPLTGGLNNYYSLLNRQIIFRDDDNRYSRENKKLEKSPILGNYNNTSFEYKGIKKEYKESQVLQKSKPSLFTEKFLIDCHFNPDFCAGKTVNIEVTSPEGDSPSYYLSGLYLIETCSHNWGNGKAKTTLLVSRAKVNVSNIYELKGQLF